jgi:hypothetical protein
VVGDKEPCGGDINDHRRTTRCPARRTRGQDGEVTMEGFRARYTWGLPPQCFPRLAPCSHLAAMAMTATRSHNLPCPAPS